MKKQIILVGLLILSGSLIADTIVPFDSAALANKIITTGNVIITAIPDVNQGVSVIKVVLLSVGTAITGWCIGFFKKRNAKK